jgi:NAD(P) transhydrogenase
VANLGDTGYTDLPSRLPTQSSTLYSNNVTKFFLSMTEKDNFVVNLEDEVVRGSIVVHKGDILPPAPLATPPPAAPSPSATKAAEEEVTKALTPWQKASREVATVTAGMGSIVALGKFTGPALMSNFFTFGLASLIGYRVVWGVTPAVSASCLFHLWVAVLNGCCL